MKLEIVPDDLKGQRKKREEIFDQLESNLSLVALDSKDKNPWTGKYDRRKSVRTENAPVDIPIASYNKKPK